MSSTSSGFHLRRTTVHFGLATSREKGSRLASSLLLLPHVAKKTPHFISQDLPPYPLSAVPYREGPCGCAGCGYRPVTSLYPRTFVGVTCTISTPAPLLIFP
jgi:hypothetical protein